MVRYKGNLTSRLYRVVWKTTNRHSFRELLSISALYSFPLLIVTISIPSHAIVMCIHVYSLLYTHVHMHAYVRNFLSMYDIQHVQFISNRWNISKKHDDTKKYFRKKLHSTEGDIPYSCVFNLAITLRVTLQFLDGYLHLLLHILVADVCSKRYQNTINPYTIRTLKSDVHHRKVSRLS